MVVFDEVYISFHFNIILKHNGVSCTNTYITNSLHLPNKSNTEHAQLSRNQTSLLPSRQCTTRYKDADGELPVSYDNVTQTYTSTPQPKKKNTNQHPVTTSDFYLRGTKIHHPASPHPLSPQHNPSTNTSRHCWVKDLLFPPLFH